MRSDEIGIIVAGVRMTARRICSVTSRAGFSPAEWAERAVLAYKGDLADAIVYERNFGGAMVEEVIRHADRDVPLREVVAARGKAVRAEPEARSTHAPKYTTSGTSKTRCVHVLDARLHGRAWIFIAVGDKAPTSNFPDWDATEGASTSAKLRRPRARFL
jgi:hypothetical protein